ncbi:hypothetical protein SCLCIDRAFT_1096346 [Scleroderma citrinum Foug A]|uniref:Uncharacterized protein n=1 Tax=Scleroderma citrinum Foug A TaxID=1036808 RepID=A0A0C2Z8X7_9AGAM|nr:hypothetical protein SCLCIDRAFT_1096346 [Scleroderma citrinum Foug A]
MIWGCDEPQRPHYALISFSPRCELEQDLRNVLSHNRAYWSPGTAVIRIISVHASLTDKYLSRRFSCTRQRNVQPLSKQRRVQNMEQQPSVTYKGRHWSV